MGTPTVIMPDTGQIVIEDFVLAACVLWSSAGNFTKMVTMCGEALKDDEVKNSLVKLKNNGVIDNIQKHNLNEKYREDVVRIVNDLIKVNKMPKIVVATTNIFRVSRLENEAGSILEVAERRMEGMDKNIMELLKSTKCLTK